MTSSSSTDPKPSSEQVDCPKPNRPISLFVTPPLNISSASSLTSSSYTTSKRSSNLSRTKSTTEDELEDEDFEDDVMDKQSYQSSQLQFTPPSTINAKFNPAKNLQPPPPAPPQPQTQQQTPKTPQQPKTPPPQTSPGLKIASPFKYQPPPSKKYLQPQVYSPPSSDTTTSNTTTPKSSPHHESLLLSPSKLFKRISRKFSISNSNPNPNPVSNLNSNSTLNSNPTSTSTATSSPTVVASPSTTNKRSSIVAEQHKQQQSPPIQKPLTPQQNLAVCPLKKSFPKHEHSRSLPKSLSTSGIHDIVNSPSSKAIVKSKHGRSISVNSTFPHIRKPSNGIHYLPQDAPIFTLHEELHEMSETSIKQPKEESRDNATITSLHDIATFSGFSVTKKDSDEESEEDDSYEYPLQSPQKSTFSNRTESTISPHKNQFNFSPSPSSSNNIIIWNNDDPVPISPTRSAFNQRSPSKSTSLRRSNSSRAIPSPSKSINNTPSELVLKLNIFLQETKLGQVSVIRVKLRKDKLKNINELTNLILFKLMNKKQDLNINQVKLLIFFKDKHINPIILKDSIDRKSKRFSSDDVTSKEIGINKDDLLLDYVQMKTKLYIKAII
ncbi:hypothetical protein G210_5247 [Candida maltosa Xu316]|uniref:Uncharacterized protein n=1 Tax=Candida maltosa (strain Xu316) TaxID=1245528 RepID=M3JQY3_CANMX|nr:hypothetical protein G210_5247 [Candida maltosa Xu316]